MHRTQTNPIIWILIIGHDPLNSSRRVKAVSSSTRESASKIGEKKKKHKNKRGPDGNLRYKLSRPQFHNSGIVQKAISGSPRPSRLSALTKASLQKKQKIPLPCQACLARRARFKAAVKSSPLLFPSLHRPYYLSRFPPLIYFGISWLALPVPSHPARHNPKPPPAAPHRPPPRSTPRAGDSRPCASPPLPTPAPRAAPTLPPPHRAQGRTRPPAPGSGPSGEPGSPRGSGRARPQTAPERPPPQGPPQTLGPLQPAPLSPRPAPHAPPGPSAARGAPGAPRGPRVDPPGPAPPPSALAGGEWGSPDLPVITFYAILDPLVNVPTKHCGKALPRPPPGPAGSGGRRRAAGRARPGRGEAGRVWYRGCPPHLGDTGWGRAAGVRAVAAALPSLLTAVRGGTAGRMGAGRRFLLFFGGLFFLFWFVFWPGLGALFLPPPVSRESCRCLHTLAAELPRPTGPGGAALRCPPARGELRARPAEPPEPSRLGLPFSFLCLFTAIALKRVKNWIPAEGLRFR